MKDIDLLIYCRK